MIGPMRRTILILLAVATLSGCGVTQGGLFDESFWAISPLRQNDAAELGVAELAKGNYVAAEGHFQRALKANPRDIDALIGSGILYQNTGQLTKAREMYEAILALRPDDSHQFVVWSDIRTRPAAQIASVNLSLLESGGIPGQGSDAAMTSPAGGNTPMPMGAAPPPAAVPTTPVTGAPTSSAMLGRPAPGGPGVEMSPANIGKFIGGDSNVVSRFSTLRALRDQGLLTEDEFNQRRQTNLGALLPLTSPPPAAGLDRPVPNTEQISGRLRMMGRALEMRAMSVSEHSNERNMILDALMPSAPVVVAHPEAPPKGLMEAADAVRRLEQLRNGGYVTSDEYSRERQAIELAMRPAAPAAPKPAAAKAAMPAKLEKAPSGPLPAVHLASYRSAKQAERGWAQIRRAHRNILACYRRRKTP